MDPSYPPPTEHEWAAADVQVVRRDDPPIIGLRKDLEKNGIPYTQTVWLTVPQLRGLAIKTRSDVGSKSRTGKTVPSTATVPAGVGCQIGWGGPLLFLIRARHECAQGKRGEKAVESGANMARILLAASPEPRAILARVLAGHDLCCPETMQQAVQWLYQQQFDQIICAVIFDEFRMLDLLRLAKSKPELRQIPFVCTRVQSHVLNSPGALESVAFSCRELGAVAFLNFPDFRTDPEREFRQAIDGLLGSRDVLGG